MVVLETHLSLLSKLVGQKITQKELETILFDLGMELDDVQGDAIKVEITADRPDLVSPQGLARALRAYLGKKNPECVAKKSDYKVIIDKTVESVRPYTVCAVVKNLNFDDEKIKEIIWVQEKLHATFGRNRKKVAIGIYPMEHITFPVSYKAIAPKQLSFVPLESSVKMNGLEILEKHPKGKEFAHLLEGKSRFPYFADATGEILSMPPIINAHRTGKVSETTKEIFIECSGHDFTSLSLTLNMIVYMFQDMGGQIYTVTLEYPDKKIVTPLLNWEKRSISTVFVKSMLGVDINAKDCASYLSRMMHRVTEIGKDTVVFEVPPIRTDVWHDVDIADDIARAYGVNKISPELPAVATNGHLLFEHRLTDHLAELTIGLGFQEVFTLALTDKYEQYEKMRLKPQNYVQLGHATEQSINMVRSWMLPELLKALSHNRSREYPHKIFEIDEVVLEDSSADVLSRNVRKMCLAICDAQADFTVIKQHLLYILESLGIRDAQFSSLHHPSFMEGRCANVTVHGAKIGVMGEVHPEVLMNFGLLCPVVAFEIDVDSLSKVLRSLSRTHP